MHGLQEGLIVLHKCQLYCIAEASLKAPTTLTPDVPVTPHPLLSITPPPQLSFENNLDIQFCGSIIEIWAHTHETAMNDFEFETTFETDISLSLLAHQLSVLVACR